MARIRSIKPELLEDEKTATLSHLEWRLFVSLLLLADDYGNFRANPARVAGAALWAHEDDVGNALGAIEAKGLILTYTVDGQTYAHIAGWEKHQKVDHPGKPSCPGPEKVSRKSRENLADLQSDSRLIGSGSGSEGIGSEGTAAPAIPPVGIPQPVAPLTVPRFWSSGEWLARFGRAWAEKYGTVSYGQGQGDAKASGDLSDLLPSLSADERLAAQALAGDMIAEYLADESPGRVKARHPWKWFVEGFNGFRVPKVKVAANGATGPPRGRAPSTATRDAFASILASEKP